MMKVGDTVKAGDPTQPWFGNAPKTITAVSEDGAFINLLEGVRDNGWWPSKCFEIVKRAEPKPPLVTWRDGGLSYWFGGGDSASGGGGGGRVSPEPAKVQLVNLFGTVIGEYTLHPGKTLRINMSFATPEGST